MLKRIKLKLKTIRADYYHRKYLKEVQQKELMKIYRLICQMNSMSPNLDYPNRLNP